MGFLSAFFSRVASKPHLRRCFRGVPLQYATALGTDASGDRLLPWSRALVPLAVAAGAALAFDLRPVAAPSLCDPGVDIRVGGKDSTEVVVKGVHREVPKEFIAELKDILQDNLTLDYEERYFHGKPQNSFHRSVNVPDVVVFPRSQGDVQKVVAACNMYKVPIVPYGGATSIEGHTLAPHGGVCVDMSLMKKIKSLNVEDLDIVVEPGIGWMELNEYLKPYGLFFPLDPGPGATIGGMCATRCSGSLAVRYGTMRDNVINVQVVLANGEVIKTGSRARKSAAGYDLTRLLIGSEGTLGIITEVTLRLQRLPQHSVVAMCNFQTIKDAADVAIATMLSGIQVSRVELLDEVQVKAINFANGKSLPEVPTLMFEFIGTEAYAREQTLIVQKIVSEHNGSDFVFVESENSKEELWKQIRKEALWACYAMAPDNSDAMITDVCVPLSRLAECISKSKEELDASPLMCMVIAHAGDGNFHTIIMFDPEQEEQRQEAERLNHFMVQTALSLEGTCTGEHGVGTGKMKYLEKELGIGALRTMKSIKSVLDPNDIMNPGKIIPPHVCI
ncbi:D-lactate dehydrogenase [cytochrome], mitochondrial isoform X2 [Zingiber officinale]|uniref:D-lactate dehydrogenase [cytochrome], mitochondrial isoform X2 n=1 Tax=Zingiber officinale TaxID=94328 RepID=UPI001C4BFB6B|nr:D-lactate dehydrogenase [cytochrome], mitochondrial isoform X2 [Zingiber officinale]